MTTSTAIPAPGRIAVILSAFQEGRPLDENVRAQRQLLGVLADGVAAGRYHSISACDGSYLGKLEDSALVVAWPAELARLISLGQAFQQDSVLRVRRNGTGVLHYHDGRTEEIGRYTPITSTDGVDAWTRIRATGEAFTFV